MKEFAKLAAIGFASITATDISTLANSKGVYSMANSFHFYENATYPPEATLSATNQIDSIPWGAIQVVVHTRYNHTLTTILPASTDLKMISEYINLADQCVSIKDQWRKKWEVAYEKPIFGRYLAKSVAIQGEKELGPVEAKQYALWNEIMERIRSNLTAAARQQDTEAWDKYFQGNPYGTFVRSES